MALSAQIVRYEGGSTLFVLGIAEGIIKIEIIDGIANVTDDGVSLIIDGVNLNVNAFDTNV